MANPNETHKDEKTSTVVEVTASDARNRMGDLLDRALGGERFKISRNGRTVAALVGAKDLEALGGTT